MFDLAVSENFDLMVSASRDLMGVSGDEIMAQRIKTRLRIERGSWVFNADLGSTLTSSLSRLTNENIEHIPAIVTDALRNIDDIEIVNVIVSKLSETQALVSIYYRNRAAISSLPIDAGVQSTEIFIGVGEVANAT